MSSIFPKIRTFEFQINAHFQAFFLFSSKYSLSKFFDGFQIMFLGFGKATKENAGFYFAVSKFMICGLLTTQHCKFHPEAQLHFLIYLIEIRICARVCSILSDILLDVIPKSINLSGIFSFMNNNVFFFFIGISILVL